MNDLQVEQTIIEKCDEVLVKYKSHIDNGVISFIGIDSITFVKLLVEVEMAFDIEFDDNELSPKLYPDSDYLIKAVIKKLHNKEEI